MEYSMDSLARNDASELDFKSKIYTIRGMQVMLDSDLADLYGVETKRLNEQVKRNAERFPEDFYFKLDKYEEDVLKSQIATSKSRGGKRKATSVFTEQGVAMLSFVLKSKKAIEVNVQIMRVFVKMRINLRLNEELFSRVHSIEQRQFKYERSTDSRFNKVFEALNSNDLPRQGIFFDGDVFDAYPLVSSQDVWLIYKVNFSCLICSATIGGGTRIIFSIKISDKFRYRNETLKKNQHISIPEFRYILYSIGGIHVVFFFTIQSITFCE